MDEEYEVRIELPRDDDGFLRRQCPACEEQFKWYVHKSGDPDAEVVDQYYCPLCGQPSGLRDWSTPDQKAYADGEAGPLFDQYLQDMLGEAFKGVKGLQFTPNEDFSLDIPARDLVEPNDMVIVEPPCHPNEPVKVPEDRTGRLHCLVCGTVYAA